MFAFQGLDTAQLIVTDDPLTLFGQGGGLMIVAVDVADFLIGLLIGSRRQPIPAQMGFNVPLFLKDDWRVAARWSPQSGARSVPRRFPGQSSG